jgi:hypothetical protein
MQRLPVFARKVGSLAFPLVKLTKHCGIAVQ